MHLKIGLFTRKFIKLNIYLLIFPSEKLRKQVLFVTYKYFLIKFHYCCTLTSFNECDFLKFGEIIL